MKRIFFVSCSILTAATVLAAAPRLHPVAKDALTEEQRALAASYGGAFGTGADFRTLLVHPELVKGRSALRELHPRRSRRSLPAHRELLILRTAWHTRSDYLWAKHQGRATAAGLNAQELSAIAEQTPPRWDDFERTLLRAADELHESSFVTNETWTTLAQRYTVHAADGRRIHGRGDDDDRGGVEQRTRGSRGGLEADREARIAALAERRWRTGWSRPRIEPVVLAQATPEIRAMLDPSGSGRDIAAVYRTFARHPKLYVPRQILSEYIRTKSTLSPRVREMLILRIGWRCRSAYEWAAHAPAGRRAGLTDDQIRMLARSGYDGWSAADAAIVRAADELYADDTISDATWTALDEQFDEKQLLDVLITTGGYRMVSMVLNTFGVAAEPNSEAFPSGTKCRQPPHVPR